MARFFADTSQIESGSIILTQEDMQHLKSLRMKENETFTVCDGNSTDYICRISQGSDQAEILDKIPTKGEPKEKCSIYAAFSKGERMEYTIQKAVELGVYELVLFPSARCIVKYDSKSLDKKLDRWQKIALEAAKQCGRGIVPLVKAAQSYKAAIEEAAKAQIPLYCYELEKSLSLKEALSQETGINTLSIVTGPEGGFEEEEAELAVNAGFRVITLGARILRCETAPIAALAAVMYYTGNI